MAKIIDPILPLLSLFSDIGPLFWDIGPVFWDIGPVFWDIGPLCWALLEVQVHETWLLLYIGSPFKGAIGLLRRGGWGLVFEAGLELILTRAMWLFV